MTQIGIDVGTTNSIAFAMQDGGGMFPVEISTGSGYESKYILPSAVCLDGSGQLLIGQAAQEKQIYFPENYCEEFKRDLGENAPYLLGGVQYRPEDLYAELIRHIIRRVEQICQEPVQKGWITCPASFSKSKRDKILQSAKLAGLPEAVLIDEPTAAAQSLLFGTGLHDGQKILVYDFGGGTFDVSVLQYGQGSLKPMAEPMGLENCGGSDIDRILFREIYRQISEPILAAMGADPDQEEKWKILIREHAVRAKHALSFAQDYSGEISLSLNQAARYTLTRSWLEEQIAPMISHTITCCRQILEKAHCPVEDLSAVLLIGGTCRIPLVQRQVEQFAGKDRVKRAPDMEMAVAQGALMPPLGKPGSDLYRKAIQCEKEKDTELAAAYMRKAAQLGHEDAQLTLGLWLKEGHILAADPQAAEAYLRQAAQAGNREAQYQLAEMAATADEAMQWHEKAAHQGHPLSQYQMGFRALYIQQNFSEALEWYRKAAEQGETESMYLLAKFYEEGKYLEKDEKAAVSWYQKAAEAGHYPARKALCCCYLYGRGVEEPYPEHVQIALEQYDRLLEESIQSYEPKLVQYAGSVLEITNLLVLDEANVLKIADYYYEGTAVPQNYPMAAYLYRMLWEGRQYIYAALPLGNCYFYGHGIQKNVEKAFRLYRLYSEACNHSPEAAYRLANCYYDGIGTKVSDTSALYYFRAAADRGHTEAAFRYAKMILEKRGKNLSSETAKIYLKKAADQGHKEAQAWMDSLGGMPAPGAEQQTYPAPMSKTAKLASKIMKLVAPKGREDEI